MERKNKSEIDPIILHIETSTNVCSVALSKGEQLLVKKESDEEKAHGKLLSIFIKEVIEEAKMQPSDLNAISVGEGPGSYTGLRIGVSTAKGLCYGLQIPLIALNTLDILAYSFVKSNSYKDLKDENILLCPMIDARRMEVYTKLLDSNLNSLNKTSAQIINEDSFENKLKEDKIAFFGNGAEKCQEEINSEKAIFINDIVPLAEFMIEKAYQKYNIEDFVDVAYFEPLYLKDFVPTVSKKNIL